MMRLLSISFIVLALTVSCAVTPSPVPQTALPSRTMQAAIAAPTNTPILTLTPTPTSTLTPTSTSTLTPTPALTPTSSLTPTPELPVLSSWIGPVNLKTKPQFAWEAGVWNNLHKAGGSLTIVDDPVFGPQSMFLSTVTDNKVAPFRIYLDKAGPALKPSERGSCTTSIIVEMSPDYVSPPSDGFVNFLSVFSKALGGFSAMGSILIDYKSDGGTVPSIYNNAAGKDFPPYDQVMFRKPLNRNTKYKMSLRFGRDGKLVGEIKVYNPDSKQFEPYDTTSASIDPNNERQIELVHGGAYGRGVPNGAWIKHSGIEVVCR
jgi:hypothetical protein